MASAFIGVHVVPMHGESRLLRNQTVLVRGRSIAVVGPASEVDVPPDVRRIEARGRFLMPGIAEMHAHVWTPSDRLPEGWVEDFMELFVLNGATTVRSMAGTAHQFELRRRIAAGKVLGPTLLTASPGYTETSVRSPEEARRLVAQHVEAGYDFIKIFELTPEELEALAQAAARTGTRFGGHVPAEVGLERAIEAGYASIEHLDGYLDALGWLGGGMERLAELTSRAEVWNAPTLDLWKTLLGTRDPEALSRRAELAYVPSSVAARWKRVASERYEGAVQWRARWRVSQRDAMLRALYEAGAGLLLASDAPQVYNVPGFSLAREMAAMVEAGLPPYAVLEAATRNPAAYLDAQDEFGTVTVGSRADLLLLDGNPLDALAHVSRPAGVMVRGRWLPRDEIERRLRAIARRMRAVEAKKSS